MTQEITSRVGNDINRTPRPQKMTSFNRPPRIRPELPTDIVHLPVLPTTGRQGRAWSIVSSLLTSAALIGATVLVGRTSGGSVIYLIPMVAGAGVFLLLSVIQLIQDYWRRWRASVKYTAALKATTIRLIQLYTDQQYARWVIDPDFTLKEAENRTILFDKEQRDLITQFVPRTWLQRLLRRQFTPQQLNLQAVNDRWAKEPNQAVSLLDIAGCDSDAGLRKIPRSRLWERRPTDPDFLSLKLGVTEQPSSTTIEISQSIERPPHINELVERFSTIQNVPLTLSLPEVGSLGVAGSRDVAVPLTHTLLWQIVTHHAPSEVRVAVIYDEDSRAVWSWLRWLPHTIPLNGDKRRRMIAVSEQQVEHLLIYLLDELSRRRDRIDEDVRPPQIVLLVDGDERLQQKTVIKEIVRQGHAHGMNVIILVNHWEDIPGDCGAMMRVNDDGKGAYALAGSMWSKPFYTIQTDITQSERLSRGIRPFVLAEMGGSREIPRNVRLLELLRNRSIGEFNPAQQWNRTISGAWHYDVPIGRTEGGDPIYLDLREHHDGPHGIIAGKTGAGKSELLQSIITAVAATHAPDRAQFMLIDFKGGASLRIFKDLPHTVGLVTDLQDGRLAERAITALKSEIRRRKDLLNKANVQDIAAYRSLLVRTAPLANLLIIIDEFDTMVKEQPSFVNELITVVKQGRSLGVHLLVATQQPSVAVKDEIKGQLQYWIALRLGSVNDSREMLQRPDAFFLPSDIPGRAYIRVGTQLKLFQAARVSATFQSSSNDDQIDFIDMDQITGEAILQQSNSIDVDLGKDGRQRIDLDFIIEQIYLAGSSYIVKQIWCAPLPVRLLLSQQISQELQILPMNVVQSVHKQHWWSLSPHKRLCLPIGLLDIPQESRQEVAEVDISAGHVIIIGAPGSGKTMLLRTLLMSLAITHSPSNVWCYVIDAGGQGLGAFRNMPHIGGLVQVREVDQVRRVIWMVKRALEAREKAQRDAEDANGADGTSHQRSPAMLLIIDKFALFREEYENTGLIDDLIALAGQGHAYDIHLIITADRPGDVPYKLQGLFDARFLLRLNDESDALTLTGRREAAQIPPDCPGRGYRLSVDQGWLEFQTSLPYIETDDEHLNSDAINNLLDGEITFKVRTWMEALSHAWKHSPAAQREGPPLVLLLPEKVAFTKIWQQATISTGTPSANVDELDVLLGLEDQALGLARFVLKESTAAMLVVGGNQSGKTTALRTMLRSLALRYQPDQIAFVLIDPRRSSFRDLTIKPHQHIYATTDAHLAVLAEQLEQAFENEADQRRWVVCIDDFEVGQTQFTTQFQKPFTGQKTFMVVLEKLANLGRERGFYLIVGANTSNPTGLLGQLNISRHGLILQPHNYPPATNLLGVRLPVPLTGSQGMPGRGLMVVNNLQQWVQVANDSE